MARATPKLRIPPVGMFSPPDRQGFRAQKPGEGSGLSFEDELEYPVHGHKDGEGHQEGGEEGLADQGPQGEAFRGQADGRSHQEGQQDRGPERQGQDHDKNVEEKSSEGQKLAVGQADHVGGLVNQDDGRAHHGVQAAGQQSGYGQLEKISHPLIQSIYFIGHR